MGNDGLSSKHVGSQASRRVTRGLAWIQSVCISINAVPALKGLTLTFVFQKNSPRTWRPNTSAGPRPRRPCCLTLTTTLGGCSTGLSAFWRRTVTDYPWKLSTSWGHPTVVWWDHCSRHHWPRQVNRVVRPSSMTKSHRWPLSDDNRRSLYPLYAWIQ